MDVRWRSGYACNDDCYGWKNFLDMRCEMCV